MIRREWTTVCSLAITGVLVLSARADTVEDLEKKLTEITAKQKSVQSKGKIEAKLEMQGFKSKYEGTYTSEVVRSGERWMSRTETKTNSEQTVGDNVQKTESNSVIVF